LKKLNGVSDSIFFAAWCVMLFVISSVGVKQENWFFVAWCMFIFGLAISAMITARVRAREIRRFSVAHNLIYLGETLPDGLFISPTSFDYQRSSIGNCALGEVDGIPLAFFDLSYRLGKGSVSQTIVAFPRTGPQAIPEPPIDAVGSYQFEAAGDWIITWIPRRTVRVEELEDWCVELHTLARDLLAEARGESEARPRLFRWMT
jgi:hypothetical protein